MGAATAFAGAGVLATSCSEPADPPPVAADAGSDASAPPVDDSKPVKFADSSEGAYLSADWRLALPPTALEGTVGLTDPDARHSAHVFDLAEPDIEVAGFLVSLPAGADSALSGSQGAIATLASGASITSAAARLTGERTTSTDGQDTVLQTTLEVETDQAVDVLALRDAIVPALLGLSPTDVKLPDMGWSGASDTGFVVTFQTLYRAGDDQTLYIGAVSRRDAFDDPERATGRCAEDMANGTALARSGRGGQVRTHELDDREPAKADIIWIVDESGSMADERATVASAAAEFFQAAVTAGIDFRMGVTDMNELGPGGQPGIFASRQAGGTGDRWLGPTEVSEFAAAINDPSGPDPAASGTEHGLVQGQGAIARHIPRDNSDPQKVRVDAQLVVLYTSDEMAQSIQDNTSMTGMNAQPTAMQQTEIDTQVAPMIAQLTGESATAHLIGETLPFEDPATCGGIHAYGYYEVVSATGGQVGSICQASLSATIQMIINSIAGAGSPLTLPEVPISASITVTRDGQPVARSRALGWDYMAGSNAIVFFNMPFDPDNPANIAVSYRSWE